MKVEIWFMNIWENGTNPAFQVTLANNNNAVMQSQIKILPI